MKDYERAFCIDAGEKDKVPDEARQHQFLAFYQKELALYIRAHLDEPIESYCLDKDLHPIFKVCVFSADSQCMHVHCEALTSRNPRLQKLQIAQAPDCRSSRLLPHCSIKGCKTDCV